MRAALLVAFLAVIVAAAGCGAPAAAPTATALPPTAKPAATAEPTATAKPALTVTVVSVAPKPVVTPVAAKTSAGVKPATKDNCPTDHPIKGNQGSRSTEDWIYHVPGGSSYAATDPEECFATTADAEAAGYRAPKR